MFRKKPVVINPPTWIIVGLGNPGAQYDNTRHNVGFAVVDLLSKRHNIKLDKSKHQARFGLGVIDDTTVLLVKPLTYMNLSGRAVAPLAKEYGIAPDHILVVTDDTDLAPGRVRVKPGGSAGGHNGHKSLIQSLGTQDYPRVKIGIGRVEKDETVDHVLGKITGADRDLILDALNRSADAVDLIVTVDLQAGMNRANTGN